MMMDWNKIVSDLPCEEINYLERRNSLNLGLFNFLFVVAKVTGTFDIHRAKLLEFRDELERLYYNREMSKLKDNYIKICRYTEDILRPLCLSNRIEIFCKNVFPRDLVDTDTLSNFDLHALIGIKYTKSEDAYSPTEPFIAIKLNQIWNNPLSTNAENIGILTVMDDEWLKDIKEQFDKKEESFMKGLLIQCIENITATGMQKLEVFGEKGVLINEIVENDLKNINVAFLPRKIDDDKYKIFVVGCFLSLSEEREVSLVRKRQIMRFTSNIIGSLPLDDTDVRVELLKVLLCVGHKEIRYPSLKLPSDLILKFKLCSFSSFEYIVYMNCTNVLTTAL